MAFFFFKFKQHSDKQQQKPQTKSQIDIFVALENDQFFDKNEYSVRTRFPSISLRFAFVLASFSFAHIVHETWPNSQILK